MASKDNDREIFEPVPIQEVFATGMCAEVDHVRKIVRITAWTEITNDDESKDRVVVSRIIVPLESFRDFHKSAGTLLGNDA